MRALIQRVAEARVDIDGETVGRIDAGLLVLVCAMQGDGDDEARLLARKIANLRIFESEPGKMNLSVLASGGGALVVSQFTLVSTAAGICTGAAAQKCTRGSVVACPRSPWEGPARGATRPPRGGRRPARGRGLWAHAGKRGVIRTVAGVVTGSA